MLSKKYKLPIQLFPGKRGKLFKSAYFTLKTFPASKPFSRFGVTISAKTAPKAAKRNEMKRRLFNFFKDNPRIAPIADYWFTVLPPAAGLSDEYFSLELKKLLGV